MDIIWERYNNDSDVISSYYRKINDDNYLDILNNIYDYIKSVTRFYYSNLKIERQYAFLRGDLLFVENKINDIRLINPNIIFNIEDDFINFLVLKARKFLLKEHGLPNEINLFRNINLSNDCHKTAHYIKNICDQNNVKSYLLPIYAGYCEESMLYDGNGFHFANVIKYNSKYYLLDITYSQFFYTVRNNLNRLGILETGGCEPGVFMLMTDKGKTIANNLITNGFIELNEEVFKTYLDAFTISFRNGLYYENTNDFSYLVNYSVDDYIKFLKGYDNLLNYENKEYLGFQKRPLKNSKLDFTKR